MQGETLKLIYHNFTRKFACLQFMLNTHATRQRSHLCRISPEGVGSIVLSFYIQPNGC